jgi:uncharacterized protein with ACT and thioredoxin-like domain
MLAHRDAAVRWRLTARLALASYWTAGIAGSVMTALHGRWLVRSSHAGEVLTAYGAGVVVLGLWVAVLELVRAGIAETGRRQVAHEPVWFAEQLPAAEEVEKAAAVEARRAIIVERVVAGIIVAVGTLAGGWATPLARRWHLPV